MRLWTVHPAFLDAKGLTALWREGLLARKVLRGLTRGYVNHPQLIRFRNHPAPLSAMDAYLAGVLAESLHRGYAFDATKIDSTAQAAPMEETTGQLEFEWRHLLAKLAKRDPVRHETLRARRPEPHPLFVLIKGDVRGWEKR
ncbi:MULTISPECIES: pyrimidine dimer DNA glycosylase/endonuclease V [unclassified Pseudodesulfovibrio]|uniref:pyrimidine dimer DNA glycosylase/endonuclease V n=1 Tax=unclassified Pseudodesulfovibrio TaxID=2661612 RepID=UPI000FEBEC5D|nr:MULTISPECIES: pyrimidine dimer DNA glycosylase/endonuclease V [unclassified Pseudodesulfovibrio]MCJ2165468.1 pyrimidine dimer DNA glycosylase/endonuclease V [Pseudodesulfovibrio sp. S3-i]RWU03216.1 DNA lyase [Pseudodesulfovibrio sp. S3]